MAPKDIVDVLAHVLRKKSLKIVKSCKGIELITLLGNFQFFTHFGQHKLRSQGYDNVTQLLQQDHIDRAVKDLDEVD